MYHVINYSVKTLVLEKFGQDTWTRICALRLLVLSSTTEYVLVSRRSGQLGGSA